MRAWMRASEVFSDLLHLFQQRAGKAYKKLKKRHSCGLSAAQRSALSTVRNPSKSPFFKV